MFPTFSFAGEFDSVSGFVNGGHGVIVSVFFVNTTIFCAFFSFGVNFPIDTSWQRAGGIMRFPFSGSQIKAALPSGSFSFADWAGFDHSPFYTRSRIKQSLFLAKKNS